MKMSNSISNIDHTSDSILFVRLVLVIPTIILRGWLASLLWNLYYPQGFDTDLKAAQFIGAAFIVALFRSRNNNSKKEADIIDALQVITNPLITFGFAIVISWVVI